MTSRTPLATSGRSIVRSDSADVAGTRKRAVNSSTLLEEAVEKNPFILPSDEDVFRMRELERKKKEEQRQFNATKKIWERDDYSTTLAKTKKMIDEMAPDVDPVALRKARESKGLVTAATAAIARERRHDNESMAEFVSKKREMFLVQMSLDIKREEIAKLEHKAGQKEEALKKSELMLEEDAIRFDAFLKENDQQAHDAMKRAEAQTKLKMEKANELKKLRHAIGLVTAERTKLRETLDDYQRYKEFLDSLTPEEWLLEMKAGRREELEEVRRHNHQAKVAAWEEGRAQIEAEITQRVDIERKQALRQGKAPPKVDIPALVSAAMPPPPRLDDEPPVQQPSDEELPMYFSRPQQLLEIFSQLEEDNLFLIQNCQDTEQQLEELRQQYADTSAAMARQSALLEDSMAGLQLQLQSEEGKAASLRQKIGDSVSAGAGTPSAAAKIVDPSSMEAMLPELRAHIVEVFERCGFKATASSDTISMLTQLEGKLESLLAQLSGMDPEYVAIKEKEKEKDRRVRVREARLKAQQEAHEVRLSKMLERAQAPVKKREGKPVMFRSAPFQKKVVQEKPDPALEQEREDLKFWM